MHAIVRQVDFKSAAKRHFGDAELLTLQGRGANAGQLYGFTAECGLKALLVAHGLPTERNGDIKRNPPTPLRSHMPTLSQAIVTLAVFPDGRAATRYISMLPGLAHFNDWKIDHRYWMDSVLPGGSVPNWRVAALQISNMLDQATLDGVMT